MKNKLDCGIVRDLLPSYADGLTSETTTAAVGEHLEGCAECSKAFRLMSEPARQKEPVEQIDYLKKVRRKSRTSSVLIGIALMFVAMALIGFKVFFVGRAVDASEVSCDVSVSQNVVTLSGTVTGYQAVSRVTFSDSAGMVTAKVYVVPKAFFNSAYFDGSYVAGGDVSQVRIDDLIVWQQGVQIGRTASRLFANTDPFAADTPVFAEIAKILGVNDQLGAFTLDVQTESEPHGWIVKLENAVAEADEGAAKKIMQADSCAMIACVEDLKYVSWRYTAGGIAKEYTVTEDDASAIAGADIKGCGRDITELQRLVTLLNIKWSGVREDVTADDVFSIEITNRTGFAFYGFSYEIYLDGVSKGGGVVIYADNSPIEVGDTFPLSFPADDFPVGADISGFSIDLGIVDRYGNDTPVCSGLKINAKYANAYAYSLVRDENGDLTLTTD